MSGIFLTDKDGKVPSSFTISLNPHLQAFNHPVGSLPLPLIVCQDRVNLAFVSDPLSAADINQFRPKPEEMKRPVVFDIKHSWRAFGSSLDLEEGLWMHDLSGKKSLELAKRRNLGMTFKPRWIADVKVDLEDAITCINFIMAHPAFIPSIPLPHYFDTDLLFCMLLSAEQARDICSLAVIAMGELIAFINHWHVTTGSNWASNFSSAMRAFIRRIQLTRLPMRGGVFDAENHTHGFFIHRAIKCGCPTYMLNLKSSDHSNNAIDQVLSVEQVPDLCPFLNDLKDSGLTLQPVTQLTHATPPLYIPPQSSVFLDIDGWRAIPLPHCLWLAICWMYNSFILPYMGPDGQYIVKFKYQTVLEWVDGTQVAREAQNKRSMAESNRVMDEILSLAERYAPTHSPSSDLIDTNSGPKLPYVHVVPQVCFTMSSAEPMDMLASSDMTVANTLMDLMDDRVFPPTDLVYPFDNLSDQDSLPVPGPITMSSLLPSDILRDLPTGFSNEKTEEPSELACIIFHDSDTNIASSSSPSPICTSPSRNPQPQRTSPYVIGDPGCLLQRILQASSGVEPVEGRLDQSTARSTPSTNEVHFLTSPHLSPGALSLIDSSVESLILQVEEEMARPHEQVNRILPGYPCCPSQPDSFKAYRGNVIIPRTFYFNVTNWQKECLSMEATYQLLAASDSHWSTLLRQHG
ncbi:hypothetical protein ARMGADRAFT_1075010 [Armillaria gallica]|uniref:Uncharacterized protein n=1 Tax=Armillaria gallica TaxID=47427 RepID=A0A2H3E9U7_ARMGA|nr:hypothetical protein ARMGADRAFT_1075010 [Armillaria gallica]